MSTLRRDLEPDRLADLLGQGKAMTIDEIVAYAIAPDRGARDRCGLTTKQRCATCAPTKEQARGL
jgi:hypothetical protein